MKEDNWELNEDGTLITSYNGVIEPFFVYDDRMKKKIKSVYIKKGATEIGYAAFEDCEELEWVIIEDGLVKIDGKAFHSCSSLVYVKVPGSVKEIGPGAFDYCRGLCTVYIDNFKEAVNICGWNTCEFVFLKK